VAVQEQRGSFQRPVYSHLSGSQGGDFIFKIFKLKLGSLNIDPVIVNADRIRIDEVISNLLTNAVQSTKNSLRSGSSNHGQGLNTISVFTTIRLNVRDSNKDDIKDKEEGEIVVSIKDRGTGIDPEIQERLFTIFATKSETGSGLGLFISKGIIEAHGGKIWAENNADGKGATFSFSLPIIN
jgi:signal transduction histidine kinase